MTWHFFVIFHSTHNIMHHVWSHVISNIMQLLVQKSYCATNLKYFLDLSPYLSSKCHCIVCLLVIGWWSPSKILHIEFWCRWWRNLPTIQMGVKNYHRSRFISSNHIPSMNFPWTVPPQCHPSLLHYFFSSRSRPI